MNVFHRLPYRRSLRKVLNRLTAIWLAIYVPAFVFLALRGELLRGLRWLLGAPLWLILLVLLHGLALAAGWTAVVYNWWLGKRQEAEERIMVESLADLHSMSPEDFEAFAAQAFRNQGFRVWDIQFTADHGVDLQIITTEGTSAVAQVKRYKGHVGEPTVRDLYGTMMHAGADHAFLVNTGGFSEPARAWVAGKPITLIDGRRLLQPQTADVESGSP